MSSSLREALRSPAGALAFAAILAGSGQHRAAPLAWGALGLGLVLVALAWKRMTAVSRGLGLLSLAALAPWPHGTPSSTAAPPPERLLSTAQAALTRDSLELRGLCERLAGDRAVVAALARDPAARRQAFALLERAAQSSLRSPGLLILDADRRALAWAGAAPEPAGPGRLLDRPWVGSSIGMHGLALVATAPVQHPPRAWVVAELRLGDRPMGGGTQPPVFEQVRLLPPDLDPEEVPAGARPLAGPDGPLALGLPTPPERHAPTEDGPAWLPALAGMLAFAGAWAPVLSAGAWLSPQSVALTLGLRAFWSLPGCGWPAGHSLTSPEAFAWRRLGPLAASPLDLLLTGLAVLHVALFLARRPDGGRASRPGVSRLAAGGLGAPGLVVAALLLVQAVQEHAARPLAPFGLLPGEPALLVLQVALGLLLAASTILATSLLAWASTPAPGAITWVAVSALWIPVIALGVRWWPRGQFGLPLLPALGLLACTAVLAAVRHRWQAWLLAAGAPGAVVASVSLAALVGLVLQPSLAHFAEKSVRRQIRDQWLPLVQRQPAWRSYLLSQSLRQLDQLDLLERPGTPERPAEELAYSAWSATDLAAFGLSSAVELLDARGGAISRFSLELPSLPRAERRQVADQWQVGRDQLTLGSARRDVLHAARRLDYHGQSHGEVHVYLADDYADLPFLPHRSPYRRLVGQAAEPWAASPVLLVYEADGRLLFSSADDAPSLPSDLAARLRTPSQAWTTLPIAGRPHHLLLERGADGRFVGLGYARLDAPRFLADTLEAAGTLSGLSLAAGLLILALGSALGSREVSLGSLRQVIGRRFALRLLAAFVGLAVLPVLLMQTVVRGFVRDRLREDAEARALERAGVARKAVEDYLVFQRGDELASGLDDAALVWIASLIRSDLDIFDDGRLVASSRRELFASGLLSPRLDGWVFRRLVLEGEARVLASVDLAGAVGRTASVPVRLGGRESGVLSVPLDDRPQELAQVLDDLDRTLRLASALFVLVAAVLAGSVARRISGPLRDVTRATRRLAQGDLEARVETSSHDELRELVDSFNQMAADLARQRQDLERSNRLAAWAEMARQVAHEVKNPLTPIQLSAEHLRRVYGDARVDFGAALELCTQTILRQVRQLRGMVTEFSAFARPPQDEAEPVDVARLLQEACRPYEAALPPGVELLWDCPAGLPLLSGERRLLERAIVNGIENALQAVGRSGRVTLSARSEGDEVEVEIRDDGPGISDPDVIARLFEPFFSTKTGGSGLGLALVRKIVEDHAGRVELRSVPGCTQLILRLPAGQGRDRASGA